jgi:hypothetical protein
VPVGDLTPSEAALYAVVNSQQIADNIAGVAGTASATSSDAGATQRAAADLAEMATALRHGLTSG